jgi:transcriptional regulator with XRE-family HTH domain
MVGVSDDAVTILRAPDGAPQYAILPWDRYQSLLHSARQRAAARGREPPSEIARRLEEGASPLRAWREYRGLSQFQLAARVGISRAYLTQIEIGERTGTVEVMARLSRCLGCLIEDLIQPGNEDFAARIDALALMPARLTEFIATIPQPLSTERPVVGSFSLVEHVCHLRDIDTEGYRLRIARILGERLPDLPNIDGETLARERDYQRQDVGRACGAFTEARRSIVEQLRSLSPSVRRRRGRMQGAGEITIDDLVDAMATHDSEHLDQLAALRDALRLEDR